MGKISSILSLLSVPTLFLMCFFVVLAHLPEGYEAPLIVYYSLSLVMVVSGFYFLVIGERGRYSIPFLAILSLILGFITLYQKNRGFIRTLEMFPGDPVSRIFGTFLGLPAVLFHLFLEATGIVVPWSSGSLFSMLLVVGYWTLLIRLINRFYRSPNKSLRSPLPLENHTLPRRQMDLISLLLIFLTVFSLRLIPMLTHSIPAGTDTPLYAAAMQGQTIQRWFGGPVRSLLYFTFPVLGTVLGLSYPAPLSTVIIYELIPAIYLSVVCLLVYSLVSSCSGSQTAGLLAGIFVGCGTGLLRITWDLYKKLLSLPFSLVTFQLANRYTQNRKTSTGILLLLFLLIVNSVHIMIGGLVAIGLVLYLTMMALSDGTFTTKERYVMLVFVGLLILAPTLVWPILEAYAYTPYYIGRLINPLPHRPYMGIPSLGSLLRWVGLPFFPLSLIGLMRHREDRNNMRLPISWFLAHLFFVWQSLFHTYSSPLTGRFYELGRIMLLSSIPTGMLAGVGLWKLLRSLNLLKNIRLRFILRSFTVLVVLLSGISIAYYYGGFVSQSMIDTSGYHTMLWLMGKNNGGNVDVTYAFDSWTGYYGHLQKQELPPTYFLDDEGTDTTPWCNRVFDNGHRIFFQPE